MRFAAVSDIAGDVEASWRERVVTRFGLTVCQALKLSVASLTSPPIVCNNSSSLTGIETIASAIPRANRAGVISAGDFAGRETPETAADSGRICGG